MEKYERETPKAVEQCSLHPNLIKEIGIIKDLQVKLNKKMDRASIAFFCLVGFVGIDTLLILWGITKTIFNNTMAMVSFLK
jgi:hypothetical protein